MKFHCLTSTVEIPGYPVDGNRWSENQSINRHQSIKLVNWYRLVAVNRWPIDNHTKTVHRLASIGRGPRNRRHACYLSDHPPHFRSPGDDPVFSAQIKNITRCTCTWITYLPVIVFPCHNVYARRLGRGFTEYKVHRQRLSSLPFWGERLWGSLQTRRGEKAETRFKLWTIVDNHWQLCHLQSELVDPLWPLPVDLSVFVNFFVKPWCIHFPLFEVYRLAYAETNFQFVKKKNWIPVDGALTLKRKKRPLFSC